MVQRVMVKGVSRQIILVESPDSNLFEKAIFILKDGRCGAGAQELLEEAQRIADGYLREHLSPKKRRPGPLLYAALGAGVTGAAWVLVSLL